MKRDHLQSQISIEMFPLSIIVLTVALQNWVNDTRFEPVISVRNVEQGTLLSEKFNAFAFHIRLNVLETKPVN